MVVLSRLYLYNNFLFSYKITQLFGTARRERHRKCVDKGTARRERHRKCVDKGTARRAPTVKKLRFVGAQRAVPMANLFYYGCFGWITKHQEG
jgi:hypothetical protein